MDQLKIILVNLIAKIGEKITIRRSAFLMIIIWKKLFLCALCNRKKYWKNYFSCEIRIMKIKI